MAADAVVTGWRIVWAGTVAAAVFGASAMLFEMWFGTQGFWAFPFYAGAFVLRGFQDVTPHPGFLWSPVLGGILVHLTAGVMFAAGFVGLMARWVGDRVKLVVAGIAYGAVVFLVMWFAFLPPLNDVMLRLDGWWFWLAHLVWGVALGLSVHVAMTEPTEGKRRPRPTGPG